MAGKGDKPRPVDKRIFDQNFRDIFGEFVPSWKRKKKKKKVRKKLDCK